MWRFIWSASRGQGRARWRTSTTCSADRMCWCGGHPAVHGRTAMVLSETFGFHDIAIRDCLDRNHMSKIHVYDHHVFTVLHAPEIGSRGHVHYVELDQFLGPN